MCVLLWIPSESSDRAMEAATSWKQLPIESAAADDLVILKDKIPVLEKALDSAKKNARLPAGAEGRASRLDKKVSR